MRTLLLWCVLAQVSTVGTRPVQEPARESPSALVTYCARYRCELVVHVSALDHELEGQYHYLELRPDVGPTAMCSGPAEGTLVTWLRAHRDQTIVLSLVEKR